ncbi:hypothetical protein Sya03_60780 [Spirilliplanes yamanashiensis]|uniref:Uncharacterized protein n=1 Tax=Spirilliplanes yamanashiensis TaxID=42233 RepID=A0A8J3YDG8_9ACTN|nr:hypothetical protein Sya03_60780 [Spirilliplanes yamanashiensis]
MPAALLVVVVLLVVLIAAGPAIERLIDRRWPPPDGDHRGPFAPGPHRTGTIEWRGNQREKEVAHDDTGPDPVRPHGPVLAADAGRRHQDRGATGR